MILLFAMLIGVTAGALRAKLSRHPFPSTRFHAWWLVPIAFLPQFFAFHLIFIFKQFPSELAPFVLVSSHFALLLFVFLNWRKTGFLVLGLGLATNLLVILLNGGLMPIAPEIAAHVFTDAPPDFIQVGRRVGLQKGIVLLPEQTRLWFLSDIFLLPHWFPIFRAAFSIGDVLIAFGAFWFFWSMGGRRDTN